LFHRVERLAAPWPPAYRAPLVPTLLQKIEASAEAKLSFPEGCPREEQIARYKRFLKVESARLKFLHRNGAGGREVCQARAAMLDVLMRRILAETERGMPLDLRRKRPPFALVATGGYGRGELNLFSDVDILFLHDGRMTKRGQVHPYLRLLLEPGGLLYTLFDLGFKVGQTVRSVDECVAQANQDMQSKTALLEARHIAGDKLLCDWLQRAVVAKCVKGHESAYIAERLEDQAKRRAKHGDSACMQEPHVKSGCGGLRDYQNLFWMAFVKCGARTVEELIAQEYLSPAEARQLVAAYDFLLRTRDELHYHCGRAVDVLTRNLQPAVARQLGYTDRSATRRLEKFMRTLYVHMRNIYLISRTVEQRLAIEAPSRLQALKQLFLPYGEPQPEQIVDGFRIVEGRLLPVSRRVFIEQPRRLMRAFLHAQQRGVKLHADLEQLIRQSLRLVNRDFLADPRVHETFLEILNHRGSVAATLRAMHEVGLLGKYVPEFGRLTCLVQHEFYHQYAADEHTLMCLQMLDRAWDAEQAPFNKYSALLQKIERPFALYLALLLHDVGKSGHKGGHAATGAQAAGRVARRLGLDADTTQSLKLIIEHHLLLAEISQRRDLDDPGVIRYVAERVKTPENLARLTLHTFADAMGTSTDLWNDFKDSLLWALHHLTMRLLTGDQQFQAAAGGRQEALLLEVRKLSPRSFHDEELQAHFKHLPGRYFTQLPPREIVTDLTLAHRFMHQQLDEEDRALTPVVQWHNEPDRGHTVVKVCTWDRAGLFCKITGALSAAQLNILSAQIFSRGDGIILDTFQVTDARTGLVVGREGRENFERILNAALNEDVDLDSLLHKQRPAPTLYRPLEGERIPTVIRFDNETSETRTAIDVETEDRVGLLYAVSHVFGELGLDISLAKIVTEKGAAMDTFYVAERSGGKVTRPERRRQVEHKLRAAILRLDRPT
jgi:[protein-PII] uridylyltransferase